MVAPIRGTEDVQPSTSMAPHAPQSTAARLHRALGPLAGGIILDATDFATYGPIGLVIGAVVGFPVGYWLATLYGFARMSRWCVAVAAAIYCTVPFTEGLPLATIISAIARYHATPRPATAGDLAAGNLNPQDALHDSGHG